MNKIINKLFKKDINIYQPQNIGKYNNYIKNTIKNPNIHNWILSLNVNDNMKKWVVEKFKKELHLNSKHNIIINKYLNNENVKLPHIIKYKIYKLKHKFANNLNDISDYVNVNQQNRVNIFEHDFKTLYNLSKEYHKSIMINNKNHKAVTKENGNIEISYPDGFYWINLKTHNCLEESKAMGHCGCDSRATTLYSLRLDKTPHITLSYVENSNSIIQCKGKNNSKPKETYHKYIVDFIIKKNIKNIIQTNKNDFYLTDLNNKLYTTLQNENMEIFYNSGLFDIDKLFKRDFLTEKEFYIIQRSHIVLFNNSNWHDGHTIENTFLLEPIFYDQLSKSDLYYIRYININDKTPHKIYVNKPPCNYNGPTSNNTLEITFTETTLVDAFLNNTHFLYYKENNNYHKIQTNIEFKTKDGKNYNFYYDSKNINITHLKDYYKPSIKY